MKPAFRTARQIILPKSQMAYKVKKLDKRYAGYPEFKYFIDLPRTGEANFFTVREWCWTTWGPSKHWRDWSHGHEYFATDTSQNSNWCWIDDDYRHRILFASQEDVALFKLSTGI